MFSTNNEGKTNLQTLITCKMTLHKEHYSSMYATTLCNNCCILWKMRSITFQFQGEPSYICTENVVCCFVRLNFFFHYYSIVLKRTQSYCQRAPSNLAKPLSIKWHIHWNMCFTAFEHADSCLQSVQHSCQKV